MSSAYIPLCLRQGGRPTLSNAHRAHESAAGEMQIKDVLDEVRPGIWVCGASTGKRGTRARGEEVGA